MDLTRRNHWVYGLLAGVWLLVVVWQAEEHYRFREAAKANLSNRSKDIANTVSACIRGMRFRGAVLQERLEPVLDELVNGHSNELVTSSELISIALLNAADEPVASAGRPIDFSQRDILQRGERWGLRSVTFVNPVDLGASLTSEGGTNPTVVLPPFRNFTNNARDGDGGFRRRDQEPPPGPPPGPPPDSTEAASSNRNERTSERPPLSRENELRPRRPPWLRWMNENEYQALVEKRTLHGLVVAMSTEPFQEAARRDLWLRAMIVFLGTLAALGTGFAWRNLVKSSDLQIRLVRASELTSHLKEMNLAAAGLAHETRNPLNIVRGLAQMISKQPSLAPEIQLRSKEIIDQADKVTAQLNEFINYSRPREVRRVFLPLTTVIHEVVRTLNYDLNEKKIQLRVKGESLEIEADEQLLRQALFNLLLNGIQAVEMEGEIQVVAERVSATEGVLEIRDNGPGVPPDKRAEIFKPYFTTHTTGTGLGLAVVQQIVLAHGWEIVCLGNQPCGAIFRIQHLKLATA